MAYAPYEYLELVKESAYGTAMASPVAGTDSIFIRLAGANRFTPRVNLTKRKIPYGGGFGTGGYQVSDQDAVPGNLQVELCYSQAKMLLDWAVTRVNVAQTLPWVTTEQAGDLASVSAYHVIMRDDGTYKKRLYQGGKVTSWSLPASDDAGISLLNLGLRFATHTTSTLTAPADTVFPTDPLLFLHTHNAVSVGGSNLLYCTGLTASATNGLDPRYFASRTLTFDRLRGRSSKLDLDVLYTASPEWRAVYEALTSEAVTFSWTNSVNTVAFQFNAQNVLDPGPADDLTPGKVYMQKLTLENQWDPAASADISFTYT